MSKNPDSKVFGVRIPTKLLKEYQVAIKTLPLVFRSSSLISSYMKYIVSMSKKYKKTGNLKLGFISNDKNIVLVDLDKNATEIIYNGEDKEEEVKK